MHKKKQDIFIPFIEPDRYHAIYYDNPDEKAFVLIVHGLGEHSGRYGDLSEFLYGQGFSILACDLRGHGESFGKRGHVNSFDDYILDLQNFVDYVALKYKPKRLFIFGHSLGALIVLKYMVRKPYHISGIIASAPPLKLGFPVSCIEKCIIKFLSLCAPQLTLPEAHIKLDMLTRDLSIIETTKNDSFFHMKRSARFCAEFIKTYERDLPDAKGIDYPTLALQGGGDPVCQPKAYKDFFDKIPTANKTFKWYDNYLHETHNEIGREVVYQDITNWINQHI